MAPLLHLMMLVLAQVMRGQDGGGVESSTDYHDEITGGFLSGGRETVLPRCQQRMEPGLCRANIPRWHYDVASGLCLRFSFGGCGANLNNFDTEDQCYAACQDEITCPADQNKTCLMSKSICMTSTCRLHPDAICQVVPCSCRVEFVDELGQQVDCEHNTTDSTVTTTTTPTTSGPGDEGGQDVDDDNGHNLWKLALVGVILVIVALTSLRCFLFVYRQRRNGTGIIGKLYPITVLATNATELVNDSTEPEGERLYLSPERPVGGTVKHHIETECSKE